MKYLIIAKGGYIGNAMVFWRPESKGYTDNFKEAGRYSKKQAEKIVSGSPKKCMAVSEEVAAKYIYTAVNSIPMSQIEIKK